MKAYIINYDLKVKEKSYVSFYDAIRQSPKWWHYLDSTWIIATNETSKQISNRLVVHIHKKDNLLIIEVKKDYWGLLSKDAWDWLSENVQY